jgi:hypothetical protein
VPLAPSSPLSPNSPRRSKRKPVPHYLQLDGQSSFPTLDEIPTPMDLTPFDSPFGAPTISPFYSNSRATQSMFALSSNQNDFRVSASPLMESHARCPSASESTVSDSWTLSSSTSTSGMSEGSFYDVGNPVHVVSNISTGATGSVHRTESSLKTADATNKRITLTPTGRSDPQELQQASIRAVLRKRQ